ncbi:HDIG domain-containing protein [Halosquirtibacter laminarini]|uniref:HDIG domain-containing protein n=1 Tax=Halosquirtibacter laminarini TaxID=3374600 RepID=A0AC61NQT7_9BACT|nr:HDIG domain-containing protein [Prolixibacteraceae bacterium]
MNKNHSSKWHIVYIVLICIFTSAMLFIAFPQDKNFRYEYREGKPWRHETLYAPFSFAIAKNSTELQKEKTLVMKDYHPYFELNGKIGRKNIQSLREDIRRLEGNNSFIEDWYVAVLDSVYRHGILQQEVVNNGLLDSVSEVSILRNRIVELEKVDRLYSLKNAFAYVSKHWQDQGLLSSKRLSALEPSKYIEANMTYQKDMSLKAQNELIGGISQTRGMVQEGERIVAQGDLVTPHIYNILQSMQMKIKDVGGMNVDTLLVVLGKLIFVITLVILLILYIYDFYPEISQNLKQVLYLFVLVVIAVTSARLISEVKSLNLYLFPVSTFAILAYSFLGRRIAIFTNTILVVMIGYFAPSGYEYVFLQFVAGTAAVMSLRTLKKRGHWVLTSVVVFVAFLLGYLSLSLMQDGNLSQINWSMLKWFSIHALLVNLAQPLAYVSEKAFGFISDFTLMELSNTNQQELLRRLSKEAPGTFQHSNQVANLSERAAMEIEADANLARAGAFYHDIGKMLNPTFYTENQVGGVNPHDNLTPEESAKIIIDHVIDGVALAKRHNLPKSIVDFITSHHGKGVTGYFYIMSKNRAEDGEEIDKEKFSYPGPNPVTKEQAVVMISDAVEAASRSLKDKSEESLKKLIDQIIDSKLEMGQLDNAPITLAELTSLKRCYLEQLVNVYHSRIAYPKDKKKTKKES